MTISICWQRKFKGVDEIVFASDSRLSAGYRWDCAQKIFPIQGPNFCISFSGEADFAFPCIFQFQSMVDNYKKYYDGAAPISEITESFIALCNHMTSLVDDRRLAEFNKTSFIIAGYDFGTGNTFQKIIRFNARTNKYQRYNFGGVSTGARGQALGFIGNEYDVYMRRIADLISVKSGPFDYEPLQALWDVLKIQDKLSHVGGYPQIVKVYKHRNFLPFAVKNSSPENTVTALFGRPFMPRERTMYPIIDLNKIGDDGFIEYPMAPADSIKSTSRPQHSDVHW